MEQCRRIAAHACGVLWLLAAAVAPAAAAGIEAVANFGSNPGKLTMLKHVPANLSAPAPLVVVLHGCTQDARGYAGNAGWLQLAGAMRLALLLPEQNTANNPNRCFTWFEPADNARDRGEALSIKQMIDKMKASHGIDAKRVFVTGLSAGGAMAAVMLATYPEIFAAGGIVAGLPYGCANTVSDAFQCMSLAHPSLAATMALPGGSPLAVPLPSGMCLFFPWFCLTGPGSPGSIGGGAISPQQWGDFVRRASSHGGSFPRVSIWHGTADTKVVPANATALVQQWTNLHGLPAEPSVQNVVKGHQHQVFKDASGQARVELYLIAGMPHGVPIDPGSGSEQCGKATDFVLDVDICSSLFQAKFWGLAD